MFMYFMHIKISMTLSAFVWTALCGHAGGLCAHNIVRLNSKSVKVRSSSTIYCESTVTCEPSHSAPCIIVIEVNMKGHAE